MRQAGVPGLGATAAIYPEDAPSAALLLLWQTSKLPCQSLPRVPLALPLGLVPRSNLRGFFHNLSVQGAADLPLVEPVDALSPMTMTGTSRPPRDR